MNLTLKVENDQINFGGRVYTCDPTIPTPEPVDKAVNPLNGQTIGVYENAEVCVNYLKAALKDAEVSSEPGNAAWASEFMCSSVSLLVDGLEFGTMLVMA